MEETTIPHTERLVINLSRPDDAIVLDYLMPFEEGLWEDKAREVLKVGVVAAKAASPALDARIVEDKFKEAHGNLDKLMNNFKNEFNSKLKDYFDKENGHVSRNFEDTFGRDGQLHKRLERALGPASEFAKKLDPTNKESVIASVESTVEGLLAERLNELKEEFSLDKEGSALSRLHKKFEEQLEKNKEEQVKATTDVREVLAGFKGKKEEAEVGTRKGRVFQENIYSAVQELCQKHGDVPDYCADSPGITPRCKTGDIVSEISGSDGDKVVLEAKNESGYTLKKALEELKKAKENRGAKTGVFVFAKGCEPPEVGSFQVYGDDIVCTFDEEEQDIEGSMLRAAYTVARTTVIQPNRLEGSEVDLNNVSQYLCSLLQEIEKFDGVKTKLDSAKRAIEHVDGAIGNLKTEIKKYLDLIDAELKKGRSSVSSPT